MGSLGFRGGLLSSSLHPLQTVNPIGSSPVGFCGKSIRPWTPTDFTLLLKLETCVCLSGLPYQVRKDLLDNCNSVTAVIQQLVRMTVLARLPFQGIQGSTFAKHTL
jgi:hypothetical protein